MIFGPMGEFLVQRKYARQVSKAQAIRILDLAEQSGLVHTSNNSKEKAGLICNCCPCCCTVLRGRTQLNHPHAFSPSRFEVKIDANACTGCGICADERCPMGAITLIDDSAVVELKQCIGCGLCVSGCPANALTLIQRESVPDIPPTFKELGFKVLTEKGKLEGFITLMQK